MTNEPRSKDLAAIRALLVVAALVVGILLLVDGLRS